MTTSSATYLRPRQVQCDWSNCERTYIEELVRARAVTAPKAVAVRTQGQELTYGELNSSANRLARALQELGVGPEAAVGLCMNRGPAAIISTLAIWKAGGVYLPLDVQWPDERLQFVLDDARTQAVLTERAISPRLGRSQPHVVEVDTAFPAIAATSATDISPSVTEERLAYIIYTSGSTGCPKGVQITHRGLLNLVQWHRAAFGVTAADHASHVASLGFDAAVWEVWPYLAAGAAVHIPEEDTRCSPVGLRDWILGEGITMAFAPTAMAERLMELSWPVSTLRILLTGGDTLRHWPNASLPFTVVNNYGPTECAVVATSGPVSMPSAGEALPTIGLPIANTEVFILDENLQKVPDGEIGEIHIAGAGLARGYLNRPELTATKFIHNPFTGEPSSRLYKTGDLGLRLSDGQIAFIGRSDDQIKIRGNRIELGEIIAVLNRHPAVRDNIVVAREDSNSSEKRLVGYVILEDADTDRGSLQAFLSSKLPDYMIPTTFVAVKSLPMTINGKVDRDALPEPTEANVLPDQHCSAPASETEVRLAAVVSRILNVGEVGSDENFFLIGGHSLLGVQLIARIENEFGVRLSLRTLFANPTVAEIAARIDHLKADPGAAKAQCANG